jgi:hypothetical protein
VTDVFELSWGSSEYVLIRKRELRRPNFGEIGSVMDF